MKIIFTGGGTAGHVTPALAIAEEIKRTKKDADILFIGRAGGGENKAINDCGFALTCLEVNGIERRFTPKNIKNIFRALTALREAKKIIKDFSPDIIVGTGGYVCWPVIRAGQKMNIPTVMHESNASPGLTTRLLAKRCSAVLTSHEETCRCLGLEGKALSFGNPMRSAFQTADKKTARRRLLIKDSEILIISFGGSGGAEKLNETVLDVMKEYSSKSDKVKHIHATGKKYFGSISTDDYSLEKNGCAVVPYIEDMATYLSAADIVICRCGAMTLSEIALVGAAAILIPSPNVTDDHQYKNAKIFEENNAAILIEEKSLTPHTLCNAVKSLAEDPQKRKRLSKGISKFANRTAARDIVKYICDVFKLS